ncbi:MAG: hypothetical protein PWP23_916 [Candidatus Sumerlaeota bacterium]|nr:hypothetical protein [Candidatus Sumerlaeota bacterium]
MNRLSLFLLLAILTSLTFADDPPTSPCDEGGDCDFASSPTPMQPEVTFGTAEVQTVTGSRIPMQPLTEGRARMGGPGAKGGVLPLRNWALTPNYSSNQGTSGPGTNGPDPFDCSGALPWPGAPNEFDALTVQGLFQDGMWDPGEQATQFAPRTIFMVGASNAGVASLKTGVGRTYPPVPDIDPTMYRHPKYAVGSVNHGAQLTGGTYYDVITALGAANFGWLAFDSLTSDTLTQLPSYEPWCSINGDTFAMRLHGRATGSENHGYVARRISTSKDTELTSGVDARALPFKEDDRWQPVVAIGMIEGTLAMAHMDNARAAEGEVSCYFLPDTDPLRAPGYLYSAIGVDAYVTADIPDSFVNVGQARGVRVQTNINELYYSNPPDPSLPGCEDWRCQGRIRDLAQIEVLPVSDSTDYSHCPNGPADHLVIPQSVGVTIADPVPNSGGGAALVSAAAVDPRYEGMAIQPESFASLIARGTVVLGDGQASPASERARTGYDTDVVHVKDVLHLAPRTSPPTLDPALSPEDRAGLLYFDLTRGTLRVSVPVGSSGEIAWMDVALNQAAAGDVDDPRPESVRRTDPVAETELASRRAEAMAAARNGESAFMPARLEALPLGERFMADARGEVGVSLVLTGFQRGMPELYWRRMRAYAGKRPEFGPWEPIPPSAVMADKAGGVPGVRSAATALALEQGYTGTVQLLAVEPESGRTAGTALHVHPGNG